MLLNAEMYDLVVPKNDPDNAANTIQVGPFKDFPHYGTTVASTNIEQANLLCDLTGWVILTNENVFREAFGLQTLTASPSLSPTLTSVQPTASSSNIKSTSIQPTSSTPANSVSSNDDGPFFSETAGAVVIALIVIVGFGAICSLIYIFAFRIKAKTVVEDQGYEDFARHSEMHQLKKTLI